MDTELPTTLDYVKIRPGFSLAKATGVEQVVKHIWPGTLRATDDLNTKLASIVRLGCVATFPSSCRFLLVPLDSVVGRAQPVSGHHRVAARELYIRHTQLVLQN